MKSFSTKVKKVVQVDGIEVDDEPVFLRRANVGEALELSAFQAQLASALPKDTAGGSAEDLGQAAIENAGSAVLTAFAEYRRRWVFVHWSDQNGRRRFENFEKFCELEDELVQAIYMLGTQTDVDPESLEAAEKN